MNAADEPPPLAFTRGTEAFSEATARLAMRNDSGKLGTVTPVTIVPYESAHHGRQPWQVVKAVFDEYAFPFDENDYDADLADPAAHYDGRTGWFAVAEAQDGRVVGCVGLTDEGAGLFELHRLYVLAEARGSGAGSQLVRWVIDLAVVNKARRLVLYSDIAFEDAHRLYRRFGFRNHLFRYAADPWQSREWGFEMLFG